jgi:D-glycero-D-manno-heptose 1,7-bisphosphate phosphatase
VRPAGVFLDRDGVLNASAVVDGVPTPPRRMQDFQVLPGVVEACRTLREAGLMLVVVTNQPDVARGALSAADLEAIHDRMRQELGIEHVWTCVHDDADGCPCREPRPGMILDAARVLDIDLNRSAAVGDRWRDVESAQRAGVHSVFVDRGYDEHLTVEPDATFADLPAAVSHLLGRLEQAAQD